MVDESLGIFGKHPGRVRPDRLGAGAHTAIVEAEQLKPSLQQSRHLVVPGPEVVGEAVDENNGVGPVALQLVVELETVDASDGHQAPFLLTVAPSAAGVAAFSRLTDSRSWRTASVFRAKCRPARSPARSMSPAITAAANGGCCSSPRRRRSALKGSVPRPWFTW